MKITVPDRISQQQVSEIKKSWERAGLMGKADGFQMHEFLRDVDKVLNEGVAKVQPPQFERKFVFCDRNELGYLEKVNYLGLKDWRMVGMTQNGEKFTLAFEREVSHG